MTKRYFEISNGLIGDEIIIKAGGRIFISTREEYKSICMKLINEARISNYNDIDEQLLEHIYLFKNCDPFI